MELTEPLKVYIDDKIGGLEKFLQRFENNGELLCEVEVSRMSKHHHKGDVFYAEAHVNLPGRRLRAKDHDFDARVSIDKVRSMLERDIEKFKEKGGWTGKAARHVAHMSRSAVRSAQKILWWRNK